MLDRITSKLRQSTTLVVLKLAVLVRGWLVDRLDLSPRHWRCCSVLDCGEVVLPDEFLAGARELRLEARVPWPWAWGWLQPRLTADVLDENNEPIRQVVALSQTFGQSELQLQASLPAAALRSERRLQLRVSNAENGQVLSNVPIRRLNRDQLLDEVVPMSFASRANQNGQNIVTNQLHDQLENLDCQVELKLANAEHRKIFEVVPLEARLVLADANQKLIAAWDTPVDFHHEQFRWIVPLPRSELCPAGDYQLKLMLEDHEKAICAFSVQPYEQAHAAVLAQVSNCARLVSEKYLATDHRNRTAPVSIVAEDFRALAAELVIHLGQPDPLFDEYDLPIKCFLKGEDGQEMAVEVQADASLRPGANPVRFLFTLRPEMFRSVARRCTLEVCLGESCLTRFDFVHQTRQQIITERTQVILDSLEISQLELAVSRDGGSVLTDVAFVTDESLAPRFQVRAKGFDEDVPAVVWELTVRLLHLSSQEAIERRLKLRTRAGGNLYRRIKLDVPGQDAGSLPGDYALSLHFGSRQFAERRFRVLAHEEIYPYCREQVRQNLRVAGAQLLVECAGQSYPATEVPCVSEAVRLRARLTSEGFHSTLSEWTVPVELLLRADTIDPVVVTTTEVTLSRAPVSAELTLPMADTFLAKSPGHYALELRVAGRSLVSQPFRLLSVAELCESVSVESLRVMATARNSNRQVAVNDLNPEQHEFMHVCFETQLGSSGHPLAAPARIEIVADDTVLFRSPFQVPLDEPLPLKRLNPLSIGALWNKAGRIDRRLTIRVVVGTLVKASCVVQLGQHRRVTTVEGALTVAPEQLRNVEAEYADILRNLGTNPGQA